MTPRELIEAFETLADAPDGVKRLRELVLQLAVQGKLLWREAASRNGDPQKIPTHWTLRKLSELTLDFQNGLATRGGDGPPVVVLRLADIKKGRISDGPFRHINIPIDESRKYELFENDILAIRVNGSVDLVGRLIRIDRAAGWAYCDHLIRLRLRTDAILPEFLVLFGDTHQAREHLSSVTITTAGQRTVNQKGLGSLVVPLPPLAEQRRIVARVDELMGLLDRLEAARAVRDEIRRAARDATLAALRDAEDTEAVEIAWARISGQMDALFNTPEDVVPLRQTILQLAVRARLVPQDPFDEPGSLLAERLAQEKTNLHRGGLGPAPKPLDSIVTAPFSLPPSWTWVRADLACSQIVDCLHRTPPYVETGFPAIRTCDVEPGRILVDRALRVDEPTFREQTQRLLPREGDVLYSREGGRFGIAAVVPQGVVLCLSQRMMQLRCLDSIDPEYFSWFLNSPFGFGQASADVGGSASPHVNISSIRQFLFPLPPEREQRRISGQIKSMMALCEDLEARLSTARELQARFAAAAVHHLDV